MCVLQKRKVDDITAGARTGLELVPKRRKRGQSTRLRSRNVVIDNWLQEEAGGDSYADLEDFLC